MSARSHLAQIGKYPVVRKLGEGATSEVWLCNDPHICQIYDAVAEENLHYLVMEYVDGGTLEKYCSPDTLLSVERTVEIVFQCTRALEFAHKLGVTHRDIKPANILHTGETDVKITDFGAALIASGETTQVAGVGSPAYLRLSGV
jgi:serine/threonine protein kinase